MFHIQCTYERYLDQLKSFYLERCFYHQNPQTKESEKAVSAVKSTWENNIGIS